MKLGFYYHIPAIELENKVFVPGYLGCFIDSLAKQCEELILFLHKPNQHENANFDYEIQSSNVKLISLPPRGSVPYRTLHSHIYSSIVKQYLPSMNALLLRGPTPLLPILGKATMRLPTILLLVGDYLAGVNSLPQPGWRRELIRLWSWYNYYGQLRVIKRSLVFVNSQALYKQFDKKAKQLHMTHTTTLTKQDFFNREDTCQNHLIHLLYTGRMDPSKGLLDMVEALGILVRQGENVVLDLVGWIEKDSDILSTINAVAKKEDVIDRIIYHGYKALGPELFDYYKTADIYLTASQTSEGFPRTIWEAMAFSVPVVATDVGSISDFIQGVAELVEPKNPSALAAAVKRLIGSSILRKKYIKGGFALANQNSLENQVSEMARVIKEWVDNQRA